MLLIAPLLPLALVLPPLPGPDRGALRAAHSISETAHWVAPSLLMQGDGTAQKGDDDIQPFDVSASLNGDGILELVSLSSLVSDLESKVRSGEAACYVHAGTPDAEDQAAVVCACTLAKLYELSAEEAFARVRGYCEVRGDDAPGRIFAKGSDAPLETVSRYIRRACASDCADE